MTHSSSKWSWLLSDGVGKALIGWSIGLWIGYAAVIVPYYYWLLPLLVAEPSNETFPRMARALILGPVITAPVGAWLGWRRRTKTSADGQTTPPLL